MRPPLAGDFALPEDRGCVRGLGAVPRYPAGFERTGEALRHPLRRPLGDVGGDAPEMRLGSRNSPKRARSRSTYLSALPAFLV